MRSDMSKVIVERPRLRFPLKNGSAYPRGHLENRWVPNLEDSPRSESMGGTYKKKRLNENLQPLVRFLRSRVGRRWDDVHSEIAARISCKSAVQKHVLDHLRDYVAKNVRIEGATVKYIRYKAATLQSYGTRFHFYVHPDTHVLCVAPTAPRKRRVKNEVDPDRLVLSHDRELRRVDGVWYEIEVAPIPRGEGTDAACFDVLARCAPAGPPFGALAWKNVLWRTNRYARRKRQLGTRELVRYRLKGSS
jgi:hypothetical protein